MVDRRSPAILYIIAGATDHRLAKLIVGEVKGPRAEIPSKQGEQINISLLNAEKGEVAESSKSYSWRTWIASK